MSMQTIPESAARLPITPPVEKAPAWRVWTPGLIENDSRTLGEVLATLPGARQEEIHYLVRLIENPNSPFALPGAVGLDRHDAIHVLLGRGLQNQDEAFVIGYTMGTAQRIRPLHSWLFKRFARWFYPDGYRLSRRDLAAFDLGLALGWRSTYRRIHHFPFEDNLDRTVADLRRELDIDPNELRRTYRRERALIPGTEVSERLPV